VSHHRMVWGPPHRAQTPALRPPTRARGQMSRCSDRSVPAAAGACRGDGQTVPASRGGGAGGSQTMRRWATHVRRPHGDASGPSAVLYRIEKKSHYPLNCGGAYSQEWKSAYTQGDACVYAKCCVYTPRAHFVYAARWPGVYALAIGVSTTSSCPRLAYAFGTQFCVCVYACLPLRVQRGRGCVYTQGDACVYTGRCFVYTRGFVCVHHGGAHLCMWRSGVHMLAIAPVVLEVCGPFVDLRSRCRRYPSSDRPVVRHMAGSPSHLSVHATDPKSALLAWRPVRTWCFCRPLPPPSFFFSCQIHDPEAVSASCIHLVDGL
jgi:hypothetical protein